MNTQQRTRQLLDEFIDVILLLEQQCPGVTKRPAAMRHIPDDIIQNLRRLADRADDLLSALRSDETTVV